jgi:predicted flap endonuclease-1-like 5' DNA nuclease
MQCVITICAQELCRLSAIGHNWLLKKDMNMLKRLFYVGLGISIIVVKKSLSYLTAKQHEYEETTLAVDVGDEPKGDDILAQAVAAVGEATPADQPSQATDDLTQIKGIGPTYAKRLQAAGIDTYAALASTAPDQLRSISQATGQAANTEFWIEQAEELAGQA